MLKKKQVTDKSQIDMIAYGSRTKHGSSYKACDDREKNFRSIWRQTAWTKDELGRRKNEYDLATNISSYDLMKLQSRFRLGDVVGGVSKAKQYYLPILLGAALSIPTTGFAQSTTVCQPSDALKGLKAAKKPRDADGYIVITYKIDSK